MGDPTGRTANDRTRYALVIRVPRAVENRIEDLFLGLAGTTKPVMGYHITILGPFDLQPAGDRDSLAAMARDIEEICRDHEPFEVQLAGLEAFREPDSNAVYINVSDPERVIHLHGELLALLSKRIAFTDARSLTGNAEHYRPHVTLALGLTDRELLTFPLADVEKRCHSSFTAHAIWLVAQHPNEPWHHVRPFPLGALAGDGSSPSWDSQPLPDASPY